MPLKLNTKSTYSNLSKFKDTFANIAVRKHFTSLQFLSLSYKIFVLRASRRSNQESNVMLAALRARALS